MTRSSPPMRSRLRAPIAASSPISTASSRAPGATARGCIAAGPFVPSKPEYGYQLPLTPREYFAAGIKATNAWTTKTYGKEFDRLSPADRAAALNAMEQSQAAVRRPRREAVLRGAAAIGDGGLLRRSDLWRQPQQGRLAHGRLSRPARDLGRQGARISRQEGRRSSRNRSPTSAEERGPWPPN